MSGAVAKTATIGRLSTVRPRPGHSYSPQELPPLVRSSGTVLEPLNQILQAKASTAREAVTVTEFSTPTPRDVDAKASSAASSVSLTRRPDADEVPGHRSASGEQDWSPPSLLKELALSRALEAGQDPHSVMPMRSVFEVRQSLRRLLERQAHSAFSHADALQADIATIRKTIPLYATSRSSLPIPARRKVTLDWKAEEEIRGQAQFKTSARKLLHARAVMWQRRNLEPKEPRRKGFEDPFPTEELLALSPAELESPLPVPANPGRDPAFWRKEDIERLRSLLSQRSVTSKEDLKKIGSREWGEIMAVHFSGRPGVKSRAHMLFSEPGSGLKKAKKAEKAKVNEPKGTLILEDIR
jgi:hypothetical protein